MKSVMIVSNAAMPGTGAPLTGSTALDGDASAQRRQETASACHSGHEHFVFASSPETLNLTEGAADDRPVVRR